MLQAMEPHRPVAGAYLCLHRLKYDRRHFGTIRSQLNCSSLAPKHVSQQGAG